MFPRNSCQFTDNEKTKAKNKNKKRKKKESYERLRTEGTSIQSLYIYFFLLESLIKISQKQVKPSAFLKLYLIQLSTDSFIVMEIEKSNKN